MNLPPPTAADSAPSALLKLQIGPVQEFIAQARSTRDLWSGSYLLSWLIAAGIRQLRAIGGELVFPNPKGQLLLDDPKSWNALADHTALLTPNFTNLFVAIIPSACAKKIACEIQLAIEDEWKAICHKVWQRQDFVAAERKDRFEHQVKRFLSVSWQITPLTEKSYATAYQQNGWQLDAIRQTRDFKAWNTGATETSVTSNKDSLSGREEAIAGGPGFTKELKSKYSFLFKHDDWIGAITLIKRLWHIAYLEPERGIKTSSKEFPIRSTRAIAGKSEELDDAENVETAASEKYFAVLALDGDQIGKWLNGTFLSSKDGIASYHSSFSAALSDFALNKVRPIVQHYEGFLIYAGGDDVLAMLPADRALECSQVLRDAFRIATRDFIGKDNERVDASAGIAIAHFKSPLQDVVRAAHDAEKRAKKQLGRSAIAATLFKRSGETIEWGCKWDDGGLKLYDAVAEALDKEQLSGKFSHRVIELLEPYRTSGCGVASQNDAGTFDVAAIIEKEFTHAISRQSISGPTTTLRANLESKLKTFLANLGSDWDKSKAEGNHFTESKCQRSLSSIIGLCQTVAFAHRTRDNDGKWEIQNSQFKALVVAERQSP